MDKDTYIDKFQTIWPLSGAAGIEAFVSSVPRTRDLLDALSEFTAHICVRSTDFHTKMDLVARISDKIRWHAFLRASYGDLSNLLKIFQVLPTEFQTISMCANLFSFAEYERALSGLYKPAIELFPESEWRVSYQFIHGMMHLVVCDMYNLTPYTWNVKVSDCDQFAHYVGWFPNQTQSMVLRFAEFMVGVYYDALLSNNRLLLNYLSFLCKLQQTVAVIPYACRDTYLDLEGSVVHKLQVQYK